MSAKKQRLILEAAVKNGGCITLREACCVYGVNTYYCNALKHVGDILSRMVNAGLLERLKPGHFKVSENQKEQNKPPTQTELF